MTARFWWKLRNAWHYPAFWCSYSNKLIPSLWANWLRSRETDYLWGSDLVVTRRDDLNYRWHQFKHMLGVYKLKPSILRTDLRQLARAIFWQLLYLQPFRCHGDNIGGYPVYWRWTVDVCDWLEEKARNAEENGK